MPPLIAAILPVVGSIISRIWPDKTEEQKEQFLLELQSQLAQANLSQGQLEVDKAEAQNDNWFVAGWRPAIGWTCGLAFAWAYFFQPIFIFLLTVSGHPVPPLPTFDMATMSTVLMGMLGLAGMRTYEKINNGK